MMDLKEQAKDILNKCVKDVLKAKHEIINPENTINNILDESYQSIYDLFD